jgi:hypothetical protein
LRATLIAPGAAVEGFHHAFDLFGHREVADAHLAQIMVHVAPEGIEQSAPERRPLGLPRKPPQHHRQVQHNHLEASFDGIRNAEFRIKFRPRACATMAP